MRVSMRSFALVSWGLSPQEEAPMRGFYALFCAYELGTNPWARHRRPDVSMRSFALMSWGPGGGSHEDHREFLCALLRL